MKVILFGASGMVGLGVLRECLLDPAVTSVLSVGRSSTGQQNPKLRELVRPDLFDLAPIEAELSGIDACFFCLGVSSAGMQEDAYHHISYDLTLGAAQILAGRNPGMTFIYVSGQGTDSTEQGRMMWARVKGKTENALLKLPFKAVMFRPGFIQPMHGITSKTKGYRILLALFGPIIPVLRALFPNRVTTTEEVGRAMLKVAKQGSSKPILEAPDIIALGSMNRSP
jgi:uncharacterized protein YbjT (DUF2867 family)